MPAAVCLGLLVATGVWQDSMVTLASTLLATVVVVAVGLVLGVWTGRNHRVDSWLRPVLDAGQTMPPFVYLVPFLALFGTSRFTAIAAAVVFAVPVTTKIVADGIRAVPVATVEAANSVGSSTWQVISKVQLPVARRAITLAVNQGLIYVLSMVVVGGLVGAGALGYDVAAGFAQSELYGKGLAAGLAIVLLGVMLDRITQAAAARTRKFREKQRRQPVVTNKLRYCRCADRARARAGRVRWGEGRRGGQAGRRRGKDCGTFNLTVSPWVGYEANAAVVAYVATKDLGCKVVKKNLKEEIAWQGFGTGEVDVNLENWGHEDLKKKYITDRQGRGRGRLHRRQRRDRLVRAAVDGRQVPGHHRLEEPEQVRRSVQDLGVRRQGAAARRRPVVRDERRGAGEEPER